MKKLIRSYLLVCLASLPAFGGQPRLEDATTAIIRLFHSHNIVMFGEIHDNEQEYEWLCKLVRTPGFAGNVDDVVVEFGNALYQKTVDRYVAGEGVPFEEVQLAWCNMVADAEPVSPVYGWFYKAVREANMQGQGKRRIRLLMGSPPGDWSKIKSAADLAPYEAEREQWYAQVVKTEVLAKRHHALLIMGTGHFLRGHDQALQFQLAAQQHHDAPLDKAHLNPGYIERELRVAGANPYLVVFGTNAINDRGDVDRRFDSWPAPVIVSFSGNWVGSLPAQPVMSGGHVPAIPLTLADQADALLYVAPCSVLRTVYLSHAELDGTAYESEMIRRDIILLGHPLKFAYGTVPQCVEPQQPLAKIGRAGEGSGSGFKVSQSAVDAFAQIGSAATTLPSNDSAATPGLGCTFAGIPQTAQPKPDLLLFHPVGALPSYEVATIKPLDPNTADSMVRLPPGTSLSPLSIRRYIMNAYGAIYPPQVVGGPDWLNKDPYVINGKVPDDLEAALQKMPREERTDQTRMMEQCLLANRFHLKAHFETRVLPVYELVPAKGGLKITEVSAPPEWKPGQLLMQLRAGDPLPPGSSSTSVNSHGLRVLNARAIKMQLLARIIAADVSGRPITDHTGFTGYFDVTDLTWAPLDVAGAANETDPASLIGALKENLGLRVIPAKDPIEVLVIDHIERPSPN